MPRESKISRWLLVATVIGVLLATQTVASPLHRSAHLTGAWNLPQRALGARIPLIRGGASVETEEDDEYDDEEYDESEGEEEKEEEDEEESDEGEESEAAEESDNEGVQLEVKVEQYDDPLTPNPMINLYASLGVMMLGRKVDIFSPVVVRIARAAFIAYLVLQQVFLLYVRIKARSINDRTPIELKNPLASVLQSQLGGEGEANGMVKNLASSFLSSKSTVLEYDLKQVRSMQSGVIMNTLFMWFLHFKMGQVQPVMIQTVTGIASLIYSPLFQVYVMGRNLERPFKNPAMKGMEQAQEGEEESVPEITEETEVAEEKVEEEVDDGDVSVEEAEEDDDESGEEEDDDEEDDE